MKQGVWLIDGAYMNMTARARNTLIDYMRYKRYLEQVIGLGHGFLESYFFNGEAPESRVAQTEGFYSWMQSPAPRGPHIQVLRYALKKSRHRCHACHQESTRMVQEGVDVGIAMHIILLAAKYDVLVLSAGDADFVDAVRYVRMVLNKEVVIVGFRGSVSSKLQGLASRVIWLDPVLPSICRQTAA